MSKYNFNPTPEQLADPKFWASDAVPEGADFYYPANGRFLRALYEKKVWDEVLVFEPLQQQWIVEDTPHPYPESQIKRPTDPNALEQKESGMFGKLKCLIGWHEWTWKFERGTVLYLNDPPPDHAMCSRCNKRYKKPSGQNAKGI